MQLFLLIFFCDKRNRICVEKIKIINKIYSYSNFIWDRIFYAFICVELFNRSVGCWSKENQMLTWYPSNRHFITLYFSPFCYQIHDIKGEANSQLRTPFRAFNAKKNCVSYKISFFLSMQCVKRNWRSMRVLVKYVHEQTHKTE